MKTRLRWAIKQTFRLGEVHVHQLYRDPGLEDDTALSL